VLYVRAQEVRTETITSDTASLRGKHRDQTGRVVRVTGRSWRGVPAVTLPALYNSSRSMVELGRGGPRKRPSRSPAPRGQPGAGHLDAADRTACLVAASR